MSRLISFRLLIHVADPLVDLCAAYPALGGLFSRFFHALPHPAVRRIIDIQRVLADTSREIYTQKKIALESDDAELKMRVLEGRDLMSVMRTCILRSLL